MKITDIRIRKVKREKKVRANVSITFDDVFVIHDLKIIEGDKGFFVAMPSQPLYNPYKGVSEYKDIVHPIDNSTRDKIQRTILNAYFKMVNEGVESTYKSRKTEES